MTHTETQIVFEDGCTYQRAWVKQNGDVRGQVEFVGESENGEYVFTPRAGIIFRSKDLIGIARQVTFLNGETSQPAETKSSGAETQTKAPCPRCGEQDYLLNLCGKCVRELVRNADTFKTEATAETPATKTKGDIAADAIIAAFEGEQYLTDTDLLRMSGLTRREYLEVRSYLLEETHELVEIEPDADELASVLYAHAKPRKQKAAA